ncbi:MAG TPA: SDR family oxidoreductase [Rhodanobacteraceae bacterium]|jgi:short-subunit dehydrogenase|nr:SDR family oxidoreductase [Rhodanobacteraceae bacterium]
MKIPASTVLITGATGGIGSAIARQLAEGGAIVVLAGRDAEKLKSLASDLAYTRARIRHIAADITAPGMPAALVARALEQVDAIDILINCAGVQNFGFFADEAVTDTAALFHVNTVAPIALINAVLPHMLARTSGQIVNVGSIFGSIGFPCFASYSASKFALRGFSEALRRELTGTGVGVTYVAPRFTRTSFNRSAVNRMASALRMNQDEPASVATSVIRAIEGDGRNRYLGWPEKLFVRVNSILPRLVDLPLMKQVDQMRPFATERGR